MNKFKKSLMIMILSSLITSCTNNTIDLSLFEKTDTKNLSNLKLKRVENQVGSWKKNGFF